MRKVKVPVIRLRISHTSFTVLARITIPFTSKTSSPSCSSPLRSAAPPFTILPIITASPSFRTVAPCAKVLQKYRIMHNSQNLLESDFPERILTYERILGFLNPYYFNMIIRLGFRNASRPWRFGKNDFIHRLSYIERRFGR